MKQLKCTVIIPAKNEQETISDCCLKSRESPHVSQLIVVANACSDETAERARTAGAEVLETQRAGKGNAIKLGMSAAREDILVLIDGDLKKPSRVIVDSLMSGMSTEKILLVKGSFDRSAKPGPVTDMLVRPVLRATMHPARHIRQPLSGMVAVRRSYAASAELPDDFGIELSMLLGVYAQGGEVAEAHLPPIEHRDREWTHYQDMAEEVAVVLCQFGLLQARIEVR